MTSDPSDPATGEFPTVERRGHGHGLFDEERHPGARKSDGGWRYWMPWLYRNTLPLVCLVVAFYALGRTQSDVDRQAEGRAIAVKALCGFGDGVALAGRKALSGRLKGMDPRQGLPREAQEDYVRTITLTFLQEAGVAARDVLNRDGTVNCSRLRVKAKATNP